MIKQVAVFVDGPGGSGKSTLTPIIAGKIAGLGLKVCRVSLPAYETPFGVFIKAILPGGLESYKNIPRDQMRLLFALNRGEIREYLRAGKERGWSFVIERSTASNALSMPEVLGLSTEQLERLRKYFPEEFSSVLKREMAGIDTLDREFDFLFSDIKTIKLFLNVGEDVAHHSRERRKGDRLIHDIYEVGSDTVWRNRLFREMIKHQGGWIEIDRSGSVDDTAGIIWGEIQPLLEDNGDKRSKEGIQIDFNELLKEYYPERAMETINIAIQDIWLTGEGVANSEWSRLFPGHEPSVRLQFFPRRTERLG